MALTKWAVQGSRPDLASFTDSFTAAETGIRERKRIWKTPNLKTNKVLRDNFLQGYFGKLLEDPVNFTLPAQDPINQLINKGPVHWFDLGIFFPADPLKADPDKSRFDARKEGSEGIRIGHWSSKPLTGLRL